MWYAWEDESVWIISNASDSFAKRIDADSRCAVGIVDFDVRTGFVEHAGMRGSAVVRSWEPERARRLLARYLGSDEANWDPRFIATITDYSNRWVQFEPDTVVVRSQSYAVGG